MNFYNHHNSVSFKSHSISVTFRFCAVLVALRALEPRSTDSLGTQHCANFESHSNSNAIMVIVKVHPQSKSVLPAMCHKRVTKGLQIVG